MLNKLSNKALMTNTKDLAAKEKLICAELIGHVAEVDERRLYADEGFPSMFAFLVDGLKYSEPAAVTRISAARLSKKCPQALCLLENSDLHLTGLHLLTSHLTEENGNRLLKDCLGKSK